MMTSSIKVANHNEVKEGLRALCDNGVTHNHWIRIGSDPEYAKLVAEFMTRGGLDGSFHYRFARAIMRENFFGPEDWSNNYGVRFSKKQLRQIADFPWNEDILESTCQLCGQVVKGCHFGFLGIDSINGNPLTIMRWQKIHHPLMGYPQFISCAPNVWYHKHKFAAQTTMAFRWYLLHQSIPPDSENMFFGDQLQMLSPNYEVPTTIVEVTKNILLFKKTGKNANPTKCARTSDGDRTTVSIIKGVIIISDNYWLNPYTQQTGVAASRKLPEEDWA